jgi:HEAT repeat protein
MSFIRGLWHSWMRGDEPTPLNIERATKAVTQPHGEAAPRRNAAYKLASWKTPAAIRGLLKRFTIQTPSGAVDTEEKQEVRDLIVEIGPDAIAPILEYLQTGEEATYPAQALEQLLAEDELIARVTQLLERLEGTHTRTPKGKVALIDILAAHDDARIPPAVRPFVQDPNDDVAFAAVDCLAKPGYEADVRDGFLELLLSTGDRPRIRTHVLEALARLGWPVSGYRRRIETVLPEGFAVTSKGHIEMKGGAP